jgi:hypothetical protein
MYSEHSVLPIDSILVQFRPVHIITTELFKITFINTLSSAPTSEHKSSRPKINVEPVRFQQVLMAENMKMTSYEMSHRVLW